MNPVTTRLAALDASVAALHTGDDPDGDLLRFLTVVEPIVPTAASDTVSDPAEVDDSVAHSRFLGKLDRTHRALVSGPLDLARQVWVGTARTTDEPTEATFRRPSAAGHAAKPTEGGLWTSTATAAGPGMWHLYLTAHDSPELFPRPLRVRRVRPRAAVRVRELGGAVDWCELLADCGVDRDGVVHPDWTALARRCDAVHVTLRGIVATQGLTFRAGAGRTAAPFWDVESTLWLSWVFDGVDFGPLA